MMRAEMKRIAMRGTPRKKGKARSKECACGTEHAEGGNWQATHDALRQLVTVSKTAAEATQYAPAFTAWTEAMRAPALVLGVASYGGLKAKLEKMFHAEADYQAKAYEAKHDKAGHVHGGRRGLVEETQQALKAAQEHLAALKLREEEAAPAAPKRRRKKKKPAEAPPQPPAAPKTPKPKKPRAKKAKKPAPISEK